MSELVRTLLDLQKPEHYAAWLGKSLSDFYPSYGRSNQNSALYQYIEKSKGIDNPTEALGLIYSRVLSAPAQGRFRQAVGIVLNKYAQTTDKKIIGPTRDLVYLVATVRANEALDGLLAVNSAKFIVKHYQSVLYDSIAVVQSMESNKKVFEFALKLTHGPFFDDGYLFEAIKLMIDCKPKDKWPRHPAALVQSYRKRIQKLYRKVEGKREEEQMYWEMVDRKFGDLPVQRDEVVACSRPQKRRKR